MRKVVVRTRTLVAVVVIAAIVAVAVVVLSNRGQAPTAPTEAAPPTRSSTGWLSFRLPDLNRALVRTNRINLAKAAPSTGAPLLVFLPATGARPTDYREFLSTASSQGYAVLGLDYWNIGRSLTRTCLADARCYTEFQTNRFDGRDPSRFSHIGAANSILDRLHDALQYLRDEDPSGSWGQYSHDGDIDWSKIVISGHSQGGGEAAFISHNNPVRGALMFSSPVETYDDVSAGWMDEPGRTPVSRLYGFDDVHDEYYGRIVGSWQRLGMGSTSAAVAAATAVPAETDAPVGSVGHTLLSTLDIGTPQQTHHREIADSGPRTAAGTPVFAPTWTWMLDQVR